MDQIIYILFAFKKQFKVEKHTNSIHFKIGRDIDCEQICKNGSFTHIQFSVFKGP